MPNYWDLVDTVMLRTHSSTVSYTTGQRTANQGRSKTKVTCLLPSTFKTPLRLSKMKNTYMIEPVQGGGKLGSSVCTGPTVHSFASLQINCTARCAGSGAVRGSCCNLQLVSLRRLGGGRLARGYQPSQSAIFHSALLLPFPHNTMSVSAV